MKRIVFFITLMMLFSFTASAQEYLKNWEKQAESGNIEAQLKLGEWYKWKNKDKKSLKWYQKAADLGNSDACYEMAQLCIKGVSKNDPSMWLLKAAENGNDEMKLKVVNQISSFYQKDKACELLCSLADNGDNAMKMKVVYQLSSINKKDKACEILISMAEKGDDFTKMQVADKLLSINQKDKAYDLLMSMAEKCDDSTKMQVAETLLSNGEKSKAIMLLKSWAEQSTSFDWTKSIVDKLISLGDIEIIHQSKVQELFCLKAKEQFEKKEIKNAYATLSQVIDQSDSPAKKLLSELRTRAQTVMVAEIAHKDSLARQFAYGAWYNGPINNGVPFNSGTLSIPYQGQIIRAEISEFSSKGAPYRGRIYAFGNEFVLISNDDYSNIVYRPYSFLSFPILSYKCSSMNTLIEEILKNVDELKNSKEKYAERVKEVKSQEREAEANNKKYEQWKKTHYHSTPKEVMCFYCAGQGYIEVTVFEGSLQKKKRWRCTNCFGRGYTLEHYY